MQLASRAYRLAEEDEKLIELSKIYLAKYGSSSRADEVRRRLAYLLKSKGRNQEAQMYLSQNNASSASKTKTDASSGKKAKP